MHSRLASCQSVEVPAGKLARACPRSGARAAWHRSSMEIDGIPWGSCSKLLQIGGNPGWFHWTKHGLQMIQMIIEWWDSRIVLCHGGAEFAVLRILLGHSWASLQQGGIKPQWNDGKKCYPEYLSDWLRLGKAFCICLCDSFRFAALKTINSKTGFENQLAQYHLYWRWIQRAQRGLLGLRRAKHLQSLQLLSVLLLSLPRVGVMGLQYTYNIDRYIDKIR